MVGSEVQHRLPALRSLFPGGRLHCPVGRFDQRAELRRRVFGHAARPAVFKVVIVSGCLATATTVNFLLSSKPLSFAQFGRQSVQSTGQWLIFSERQKVTKQVDV